MSLSPHEAASLLYVEAANQDVQARHDYSTVLTMDFARSYATRNPDASALDVATATNRFVADFEGYERQAQTGESERVKEYAKVLSLASDAAGVAAGPYGQAFAEVVSKASAHLADVHGWVYGDTVKIDSQQYLADLGSNEANSQRARIREYSDAVHADPRLANVDRLIISKRLNLSPFDSTAQILDAVPRFHDSLASRTTLGGTVRVYKSVEEMRAELRKHVGPNGDLTLKVDDLNRLLKDFAAAQEDALDHEANSLGEIAGKLNSILDAQDRARVAAEQKQLIEMRFQAAHSTVNVFSTLLEFAKVPPRTVSQLSVVSHSLIAFNEALHRFDLASGAGGEVAHYGTALMVGDMVGLAAGLAKVFMDTGPTPEQMILGQLVEIQKAIGELRQEMHERFDRVDRSLNEIHRDMALSFNTLIRIAASIKEGLNSVQTTLYRVSEELETSRVQLIRLEIIDLNIAQLLTDVAVKKIHDQCYRPSVNRDNALTVDQLETCLQEIETLGVVYATNPAVAEPGIVDGTFSVEDALKRLNGRSIDRQVNLLLDLARLPEYRVSALQNLGSRSLPSIRYWTVATRMSIEVITRNRTAVRALPPRRIKEHVDLLAGPGRDLAYFMESIRSPEFVARLMAAYTEDLRRFMSDTDGLAGLWSQALTYSANEVIGSQAPVLDFLLEDQSGRPTEQGLKIRPEPEAQRHFPRVIQNLLAVKTVEPQAAIQIGWFGHAQSFKNDGARIFCYGMPYFKVRIEARFDGNHYLIMEQTAPSMVPDNAGYRWHMGAPAHTVPCPDIDPGSIAWYFTAGNYGSFFTASVSGQLVAEVHASGGWGPFGLSASSSKVPLASPDGPRLSKAIAIDRLKRSLEVFQAMWRESLQGSSSPLAHADFAARVRRLELRKETMAAFLAFAFPEGLLGEEDVRSAILGRPAFGGLVDQGQLLRLVDAEPLIFESRVLRPELHEKDDRVERLLNPALRERRANTPEALTDEERSELISVDAQVTAAEMAIRQGFDAMNLEGSAEAFSSAEVGGVTNAWVEALKYRDGSSYLGNPILKLRSQWVDGRAASVAELLKAKSKGLAAGELNPFGTQLEALRAAEKYAEAVR